MGRQLGLAPAGDPRLSRHLPDPDAAAGRAHRHQSGGRGHLRSVTSRSQNFLTVLANPNVAEALANTLIACGGGTLIAVADRIAVLLDRRSHQYAVQGLYRRCQHSAACLAPPLVAGVAWAILGSPKTGLINTMFKWMRAGLARRFLFDVGTGARVRHLLRALRLHVHRFRRCATWIRAWKRPPRFPAPARSRRCSR